MELLHEQGGAGWGSLRINEQGNRVRSISSGRGGGGGGGGSSLALLLLLQGQSEATPGGF